MEGYTTLLLVYFTLVQTYHSAVFHLRNSHGESVEPRRLSKTAKCALKSHPSIENKNEVTS